MRKYLLPLSFTTLLSAEQMYLYEFSPIVGTLTNSKSINLESSFAYGVQFQYNDIPFFIKPELTFVYSSNIAVYDSAQRADTGILMLNGVYDLEYTALLTPFLKAGVGYQHTSDVPDVDSDLRLLEAGAGLKLHVHKQFALKFEALFTQYDSFKTNIFAFGGLTYFFGQEENSPKVMDAEEHAYLPTVIAIEEDPVQEYRKKAEVIVKDADGQISSVTLFIPFLFRSDQVDDHSRRLIAQYARIFKKEDLSLLVVGHTDSRGRRAFNKELSLKRAEAVKRELVGAGMDPLKIRTEGHGEEEPIAGPGAEDADETNRRIEIIVEKSGR